MQSKRDNEEGILLMLEFIIRRRRRTKRRVIVEIVIQRSRISGVCDSCLLRRITYQPKFSFRVSVPKLYTFSRILSVAPAVIYLK